MACQGVSIRSDTDSIKEEPHLIEHILQLELRQSRALNILDSAKILGHALAIFSPYRLHLLLAKLLAHLRIVTQIGLSANNETRYARAMVVDLREPFFPDVLETGR